MCRLLKFLVDKRLAGAIRDTNEYTIGIEVFDRDPSTYNTGEDPIVRVQIGRLRERLKDYYSTLGSAAELTISIPIGSYMPMVRKSDENPIIFKPQYLLAILPIHCLTTNAECVSFTQGLSEELTHQLFKEFGKTIVSHTFSNMNRVSRSDATIQGEHAGASHLLEGSIRVEGGFTRASFRLLDATVGCIAWAENFDRHASFAISLQEDIALSVCEALKRYFSLG